MKSKGNKMKLQDSLIGFLCLFAFCNVCPDASAPPVTPSLLVTVTPTNTVLLAWPTGPTSLALVQKPTLGTKDWGNVTNIPTVVGAEYQVII
jgi:hypothetical protein